jgi:hypothetical protein
MGFARSLNETRWPRRFSTSVNVAARLVMALPWGKRERRAKSGFSHLSLLRELLLFAHSFHPENTVNVASAKAPMTIPTVQTFKAAMNAQAKPSSSSRLRAFRLYDAILEYGKDGRWTWTPTRT